MLYMKEFYKIPLVTIMDTMLSLRFILSVCFILFISSLLKSGPDNIAPEAKVTAASSLSPDSGPQNVSDGVIHIIDKGEWISNSGMISKYELGYRSPLR